MEAEKNVICIVKNMSLLLYGLCSAHLSKVHFIIWRADVTAKKLHSKNKNVEFEPKLVEFDLVPRRHSSN